MTLQDNEAFVYPTHSGRMVLLNKLDYLIPLIKSFPWLPWVARVKCRLRTMTPATKPPCQAPNPTPCTPLSPSHVLQVPWHFCPPTPQVRSPPGSEHWLFLLLEVLCPQISEGPPASQIKCQSSKGLSQPPRTWSWNHAVLVYTLNVTL